LVVAGFLLAVLLRLAVAVLRLGLALVRLVAVLVAVVVLFTIFVFTVICVYCRGRVSAVDGIDTENKRLYDSLSDRKDACLPLVQRSRRPLLRCKNTASYCDNQKS